ncbi:MAG TPA: HAD-IB family phosphatase [Gaiellaceae bacterium]|nr:HAD-IB family phosphatase [Gaiellaceae bacterium]
MRLVVDFDGTVTETDTQWMVLEEFGDVELFRRAEEALDRGELTLRECMELEYLGMRAPLEQVNEWLVEHARIRPGFRELAARHRPLILSSGFAECIQPLLRREGIELDLLANSVDARPDGWRVRWRDEEICAECGEACKRASLPDGPIAYVGDGVSDRCAALAADRVFARDGLARFLDDAGVTYVPFGDFFDVAAAL